MVLNENQKRMYNDCIFLNEGMFDEYSIGYYKTTKENDRNISNGKLTAKNSVFNSANKALRIVIGNECNGRLEKWKDYECHFNEYKSPIIIDKKYENKLKTLKISLYKVKFKGKFNNFNDKKYGYLTEQPAEIISKETDFAINFIKKYKVKIKFEDKLGNVNINERKKIYTFAKKTYNEELKVLREKHPEIKNSITNYSEEKENIEKFLTGRSKSVAIGYYDVYKFSKNPRNDDTYSNFQKYQNEFLQNIDKKLTTYKCKMDIDGDWDDGTYNLII